MSFLFVVVKHLYHTLTIQCSSLIFFPEIPGRAEYSQCRLTSQSDLQGRLEMSKNQASLTWHDLTRE